MAVATAGAAPRPARAARRSRACSSARSSTSRRTGARRPSRRRSSRRSTCSRSGSGSARSSARSAGYDYVQFVGTGTVATAVLFSSAFPAMFGTFVKYKFQHTYDAILAAPVDTEELVTAEALWIADARRRLRLRADDRRRSFFGLDPRWTMLLVPVHRLPVRLRLGLLRDRDRRLREVDRELQLHHQRRPDAAVPRRRHVLPDHRACPTGGRRSRQLQPAPPVRRARPRAPRSASTGWADLLRVLYLVGFGVLMWRVAIRAMTRKLID